MSKGTILLVEPDDDIRNMLKVYFSGQGYYFEACDQYQDAVELSRKQIPSVIGIDLDLKDENGWDLIKDLRETKHTSHLPIIVISEVLSQEDKARIREANVDSYVSKPFDVEELKLHIQNASPQPRKNLNPSSGFPTGSGIEAHLREIMQKNIDWIYFDVKISNFEPFKEVYGWQAGNEVIKVMALMITEILEQDGTKDDFAGHPGGDNFAIITQSSNWMMAVETLKLRADAFFATLYSETERKDGMVKIGDRKYSLMSLSYGVFVAAEHPRDIGIRDITEIAARHRRKLMGYIDPDEGILIEW